MPARLILTLHLVVALLYPSLSYGEGSQTMIVEPIPAVRNLALPLQCRVSAAGGELGTGTSVQSFKEIAPAKERNRSHGSDTAISAARRKCALRSLLSAEIVHPSVPGRKVPLSYGAVANLALFSETEGNSVLTLLNVKKRGRSVALELDGRRTSINSPAPFAFTAAKGESFLIPGPHTITALVYQRRNGRGRILQKGTLSFTTRNVAPLPAILAAPVPSITSIAPLPLIGRTSLPVTITFPEAVTGFTERDVVIVGGAMNNFTPRTKGAVPDSYSVFTFDLSVRVATGSTAAEATVSIPIGAAVGSVSNLGSEPSVPFVVKYYASSTSYPTTATPSPVRTATSTPVVIVVNSTPTVTPTVPYSSTATPVPQSTPTPTRTVTPTVATTPAIPTAIPLPTVGGVTCTGEYSSQLSILPAFPGAEGHGRLSVGGSGRHLKSPCTRVFKVSTLADAGPGSLRECIAATGPRVCIFEVAGMIWATEPLRIKNPYLTIAGQTAPSPGIAIRGSGIINEASEVILQHLKLRVGDDPRAECCKTKSCGPVDQLRCTADPGSRDGITTWNTSTTVQRNVLYDHLSISWALDEGFSIVPDKADVSNITFSNSIISSGLDMSIHPEANTPGDLGHSKAVLIHGAKGVRNLSFLRVLLAHNADRNIRAATPLSMEYVNNVIYNWGRGKGAGRTIELTNSVQAVHALDLLYNYYRPGKDTFCPETTYRPETCPAVATNGIDSSADRLRLHSMLRVGSGITSGLNSASRYFLLGNITTTRPTSSMDEWKAADKSFFLSDQTTMVFPTNRSITPIAASNSISTLPTEQAYQYVLLNAGSRPKDRDSVDAKVIEEVQNGTGQIINCVAPDGTPRCMKNAGGWPVYPVSTRPLSPPTRANDDDDGDGYTNLEEFLQEHARLVEQS